MTDLSLIYTSVNVMLIDVCVLISLMRIKPCRAGILEIIGGSGAAAGGGALCVTRLGCIGGAPAIAAGVALQVHGAATFSVALANIIKQLGVVFHSSTDGTGSGNYGSMTTAQLERSRRSYQALIEEHEKKLTDYIANPDAYDNRGLLRKCDRA